MGMGTHVDAVRNVVVSHVDMVKKWKGSEQQGPLCFFLDLPRFDIATRSRVPDEGDNMYNVIEEFKRFPSGEKTGLTAKEQLFLAPPWLGKTMQCPRGRCRAQAERDLSMWISACNTSRTLIGIGQCMAQWKGSSEALLDYKIFMVVRGSLTQANGDLQLS